MPLKSHFVFYSCEIVRFIVIIQEQNGSVIYIYICIFCCDVHIQSETGQTDNVTLVVALDF